MRLIDLDQLDMPGATMVKRQLEKWVKDHPINEIVVREDDEWIVKLERKQNGSSKQ